jgi:hypothetical protein
MLWWISFWRAYSPFYEALVFFGILTEWVGTQYLMHFQGMIFISIRFYAWISACLSFCSQDG